MRDDEELASFKKVFEKKTCKVRAKQVIYLTVVRRELERQKNKFKKVLDKEL
ncbi:hypothetical protein [Lactobacillus helveticus]|uniref:hypothetical protein n=1 Tax=Lactobacillus helveticus TaxID=1587 RepID=UPI0003E96E9F|nr:hypothetical protein [Lactobacillus helveticus]AHI11095.1 hypothetical protein LBH_0057 [Lactobacillus helveticus H9]AHI11412.1 hypothetical protein LBH_0384 [Lactobacillus helveticus H9]QYH32888.1 hypothetical protein HHX45_00350 [Lactobacillus helveticus]QYH32889.1 hypothetical protein HHX45_00385 [Lactobacillus helveticus]QYH33196.1 hypothetical protein HHX45_02275 [Lactobacillus helveticus]